MRKLVVLALCLLFYLPVSYAQNAHTFRFLTHFIMPFSYEEGGEFKGFAVEIVRELMNTVQHPKAFEMMPFQRGLYYVQNHSDTALFIVARRPEREDTVKWVGPIVSSGVYFYTRKDHPRPPYDLDDLKKMDSISVGRGNADHTYLESLGFQNLYPNNDQLVSLQMVESGRVAATVMSELVMPEMAKKAGIDISRLRKTDVKLYDSELYLAFSKDTPDSVVRIWQDALDTLKASDRYDAIYKKYVKH
ncbi:transporter substrate-binding domain-containing protein [Vibrio sp. JC009]|uniref:substrate-binding periplasmic protein n=1 Tax=Vibrio sp. JC009 TaxID=2912314 RepID=UPI0023AFA296|nr:transporter substrate-binding domain-containing protein [Vibrio sp. JC009]WED24475.1 transporter substrate-binding domain-containing protein [Vibrio sp. JC009]